MSQAMGRINVPSGSMTWTAPPGFCGPIMFEGQDGTGYRSALAIAAAGTNHTITFDPANKITLNGATIMEPAGGTWTSSSCYLSWWQQIAAYKVFDPFTSPSTLRSPPGHEGPVLYYCAHTGSTSRNNFSGYEMFTGSTRTVNVAQLGANYDYNVQIYSGTMICVWFP